MKTCKFLSLFLVVTFLCPLFAQNTTIAPEETVATVSERYEITDVVYSIEGMTQERLLNRKLESPKGRTFDSADELAEYIENLRQKLINFQFFSEVTVFYELIDTPTTKNATVHIAVKDALTLIILPGPKYNSNDGLSLKLKYKENNFLGTMESVFANLEFNQNHNDEKGIDNPELCMDMSFAYPFMISKVSTKALLDSEIAFQNIATEDYLFRFNATAGLEAELYRNRTLDIATGVKQGIFYNEQDDDFNTYEGDELFYEEQAYVASTVNISDFGKWGKLTYNPKVMFSYKWDTDGINPENTDIIGPQLSFSHGFNFGQVNYSGLFRNGVTASVNNSYTYNCNLNKHDLSFTACTYGYYQIFERLGINSRLGFFSYLETKNNGTSFFADGDESRGSYLRGVRNHRVKTDLGLYCSVDFPIHVFSFNAKKIAENHFPESKFMNKVFGSLGFDFIFSPYIDFMLTHYNNAFYANPSAVPEGDRYFSFSDAWYAAGADLIIVPHKFQSQNIRIGIGWDLEEVLKQKSLTAAAKRDGESIYELILSLSLEY